jgi:hypothetical protein
MTVICMKDPWKTSRKVDMEYSHGRMDSDMRVCGRTVQCKGRESFIVRVGDWSVSGITTSLYPSLKTSYQPGSDVTARVSYSVFIMSMRSS